MLTLKGLKIGPCDAVPVTEGPIRDLTSQYYTQDGESSDHMGENEDS
jgi:hypothetical protein